MGSILDTDVLGGGPGPYGMAKDISDYAFSVSVNRGRSRELEEIQVGTATVEIRNGSRVFDPQFSAGSPTSALFGPIIPGKRVRISDNGVTVFDGVIEDWNFGWSPTAPMAATAQLVATDTLATLAAAEFAELTAAKELPKSRIVRILDVPEVRYPLIQTDLDDGLNLIAYGVVSAQSVLGYLQSVAMSDGGRLFASRSNQLTFRDRDRLATNTVAATFDDTGANIPFHSVSVVFGSEQLYTRITVTGASGVSYVAVASDELIATYGERALNRDILSASGEYAQQLASWLLARYQEPLAVVEALDVILDDLTPAQRATVAGLELGDIVSLSWTPTGTGTTITQELLVEGITYSAATGGPEVMSFRLSNAEGRYSLVLDSSLRGVLDTDPLAL